MEQPECPLMGEWINKMWFIHTMKCYSAFSKEGNPVICKKTWMDLKDTMLNEINHSQKDKKKTTTHTTTKPIKLNHHIYCIKRLTENAICTSQ